MRGILHVWVLGAGLGSSLILKDLKFSIKGTLWQALFLEPGKSRMFKVISFLVIVFE